MKKYIEIDPWQIIENSFDQDCSEVNESLFSTGNGFMGTRGNFEEGYTGSTLPGSYYAGIYYPDKTRVGWWKNGYPEYFAKVLNGLSWIDLQISTESEVLNLAESKVTDYQRILNLKTGILTRSFVWHSNQGMLKLCFERFCSFHNKHIGANHLTLESISFDGKILVTSSLNYDIRNKDSNYDEQFWEGFNSDQIDGILCISAFTKKTGFEVAAASSHIFENKWDQEFSKSDKSSKLHLSSYIAPKQKFSIAKLTTVQSSLYSDKGSCLESALELNKRLQKDYTDLKQDHVSAWAKKWEEVDIEIIGDTAAQQGIRFNIFQLLQTYRGDDSRLNIGPKGFTGEKYGGSTYWDTEAYCLPFYYHTCGPSVAKQLLRYRFEQLDKAIANATKLGFNNGAALYPMVTMNGEECHNEWEITFEEIHRNGAIAYAIYYYLQATGDLEYVNTYGLPVLIAIARFWDQRISYSQDKNRFVILGVTGPNEYENNVNNNWYTNYISCWCLKFTLARLKELKLTSESKYNELATRLSLTNKEFDSWINKSSNMYFPVNPKNGIILQQEGFLDKEILPASSIPSDQYPINQHWSWDRILRSCFIKQADVLQGMYFFENDFSLEEIGKHFDFYEPMTVHESSLSPCVHSILAAKLGRLDKSYELYIRTARLDLDNYNYDTEDGLHITSMAGTWMSVVYGFAGVRILNGTLSLSPRLPNQWKGYNFKLIHQETVISISISKDEVLISSSKNKTILLYDSYIEVSSNKTNHPILRGQIVLAD